MRPMISSLRVEGVVGPYPQVTRKFLKVVETFIFQIGKVETEVVFHLIYIALVRMPGSDEDAQTAPGTAPRRMDMSEQ